MLSLINSSCRHNAFVNADTSGYLHWWCSQNSTGLTSGSDAVLIRLGYDSIEVSRRLYAFAGFFRFARPGSVRIDANSTAETMYVSAFENTNGTLAIPVINAAHFERQVQVNVDGCQLKMGMATAYLADNDHNNTMVGSYHVNGSSFLASVPPRSMTTFFLE